MRHSHSFLCSLAAMLLMPSCTEVIELEPSELAHPDTALERTATHDDECHMPLAEWLTGGLGSGCPVDTACRWDEQAARLRCSATGSAPIGAPCLDHLDCGAGFGCHGGYCRLYCFPVPIPASGVELDPRPQFDDDGSPEDDMPGSPPARPSEHSAGSAGARHAAHAALLDPPCVGIDGGCFKFPESEFGVCRAEAP